MLYALQIDKLPLVGGRHAANSEPLDGVSVVPGDSAVAAKGVDRSVAKAAARVVEPALDHVRQVCPPVELD